MSDTQIQTRLINFNVPSYLHNEFKTVCSMNRRSMTTALVDLIRDYIQKETLIISDNKNRLDSISNYTKQTEFDFNNNAKHYHSAPVT